MSQALPCVSRSSLANKAVQRPWYLAQPIIHRGLHNLFDGVLEHTRCSIERAIAAGLPIEVDIETSMDDRNFVIHDAVLDKLTNGTGRLRLLTAARIRSFSLWFTDGEPIMFLEELLDLVDGRVPLILEFKNRELAIPRGIALAAETLTRYKGVFAVTSFSPILIEWFRERYPSFTRGLVTTDTDTLEARDQFMVCLLRNRIQPHFFSHQWCQLNCWTFQWVLEQDMPIIAWTVRDREDWAVARDIADNMMFEFIAPDKGDWRREAAVNWRAGVGEEVDRRHLRNHPIYLKHDQFKGSSPWWSRNRSWPPALAQRPPAPGTETAGSYDSALWQLSVFENKRDAYKGDAHFRGAWRDWQLRFGTASFANAHSTALLLLRPDARTAGEGLEVLRCAEEHGFSPLCWFERDLDRSLAHGLMHYEWASASATRIERELERFAPAPLLVVLLADDTIARDATHGVPAAVRLSCVLRDAGDLSSACLPCVEPADLFRAVGVLLSAPERRELFATLEDGGEDVGWSGLQLLVEGTAGRSTPHHDNFADALLPDRTAPFAALTAKVAASLWAGRTGK